MHSVTSSRPSTSQAATMMSPSEEAPEAAVNGQTSAINPPPGSALRAKQKPKKGIFVVSRIK